MENAKPLLATATPTSGLTSMTPVSLIILPAMTGAGSSSALQPLQPLTVITTSALNTQQLQQQQQHHPTTISCTPLGNNFSVSSSSTTLGLGNAPFTGLLSAAPVTNNNELSNTTATFTTLTALPLVAATTVPATGNGTQQQTGSVSPTSATVVMATATSKPAGSSITSSSSSTATSSGASSTSSSAVKHTSGTPPLKPAKKFRQEQEEILRCKRRLDFVHGAERAAAFGLQRPNQSTVLRRNERERNRVKLINHTFVRLRDHLPGSTVKTSKGKAKKLSKVDTLQNAIDYIRALQTLIDEHDAVNAVFDQQQQHPRLNTSSCTATGSSNSAYNLNTSTGSSCGSENESLLSPGSAGESEAMSGVEDDVAGHPPLSPEEADLLDFTSWF